jgi:hypothetical protein
LPDVVGPCPIEDWAVHCAADEIPTYTMSDELCMTSTGCAKPGICPLLLTMCDAGYDRVSWATQPNACQTSTCEPAFFSQ